MTTKKEKREKHAKKLFRLKKEKEELLEKLKEYNEKIAKEEERVVDLFEEGHHTIGKLIIIVLKKISKGRAYPSWKNIAEDMNSGVDEFRDSLIDNDYDAKTANKFAKIMKGAFERTKEKHTTKKEDTETTTVDIKKSS
ncbi:MAG: hypothetical protein ACTSW7_01600 [Candidatus Thorarchaeota archaeon]